MSVRQLDGSVLPPGTTLQLTLAAMELNPASAGARIVVDWTMGQDPIFLAYRVTAGADAALFTTYANLTSIHTSPIANTYDVEFTTYITSLGNGDVWSSGSGPFGVVVRQLSSSATQVGAAPSTGVRLSD